MSEPKDIPDTSSAPASSSAPDSAITPRAQRRDLFSTLTPLPAREGQPALNASSNAVVGSASPAGRQHSTGEGSTVSRSSSLHGRKATEPAVEQRRSSSGRRAGPSGAKSQASSPPSPHAILGGQKSGSRHLSLGSATTRPVAPLSTGQRTAFEEAVAASSLASTSSGLQALLRDHPELVSSELAKAAGENWSQLNESARGSRVPSGPSTPTGGARGTAGTESGAGSEAASEHGGGGWPGDGLTPDALRAQEGATPTAAIPAHTLGGAGAKPDYSEAKIVVAMVGLPARGKSYLSNKLMRYLRWLEYSVKVFNVGQLRRALARAKLAKSGEKEDQSAAFFDPDNPAAYKLRTQMAEECLEQLISWLKKGGNVGIHDATNSSRSRREALQKRIDREPGMKLLFLESVCTDPAVIAANIAVKVSSGDPDYDGMSPEDAKADFLKRIAHYEASYESVDANGEENHLSYCKVIDVGRSVTVNQIHGYLESRIAFYLMNLHITPRNIFFSRHGESQYNVEGKIGGDSYLSPQGEKYAEALPKLVQDAVGDAPLTVWTSTLKRTAQTAAGLPYPKLAWKSLDELDAGVCDAMTYEEIEKYYPEDYASRDEDKFNYRYRGGESYRDVVVRLEPVIMELERQENILIIGHQAILRCLYAYFHGLAQEDLPYIKIPLHTVIQLTPKAYGCDEKRFQLPIEAVDTHRPKPPKQSFVVEAETAAPEVSKEDGKKDEAQSLEEAMTSLPPSQIRRG
ncbi:bifunctional 6-phosphofructo-2-kinase/fructose-2,6-bisphosphate 2-phosphatase [Microstroma glucosiphilum]|uniref:fructose-2,6-bisphosphate 2-phosphatase n=1 Tax=Pseudomicrostroma glucosiphilum TaxID=1684307 RepID=A0A316UGE7_9BASI|nr:bifunctional 6-phosphofructo-2-kinase/fructose-2,6-bisphosphate 2-phosphatase [Pseudomicrostroma glucosiphilum]PWN24280.1 bifunctional 6-phosphofructo-2-kinase/fructose-2,6-bisphosphate 2-phosphatase [Pseudomicrostroma glucosiphilum]